MGVERVSWGGRDTTGGLRIDSGPEGRGNGGIGGRTRLPLPTVGTCRGRRLYCLTRQYMPGQVRAYTRICCGYDGIFGDPVAGTQ
jgi:hypothetical protein